MIYSINSQWDVLKKDCKSQYSSIFSIGWENRQQIQKYHHTVEIRLEIGWYDKKTMINFIS